MKKIISLLLLIGIGTAITYAQSPWLSDTRTSSISLEWDKPLFDKRTFDRDDITGASSALFLTGRFRVNENLRIVGELPLSHLGFESAYPLGDDNSTVVGNFYLGSIWDIETVSTNNHAFVELGVRIPTTPEMNLSDKYGSLTGLASEESDRTEAFIWDTWAVPVIGNFISVIDGPFAVKTRLGTVYDIFVDDLKDVDNEMWLLYGITALYRDSGFEAHLGFSGRNQYVGLPEDADFFDSGFTQLRGGVGIPFGKVTPTIYARLPLGSNYNEVMDMAYGFSIEIRR